MEYRQEPKFSFWRRLTSGNFGQRKKEPISVGLDNYVLRSTSTPASGQSVNYSLRRSGSRERDLPTTPSGQSVNYALRRSVSRERDLPTLSSQGSVNYSLRRSVSRERELPSSPSGQSVNYSLRRSVSRERDLPSSPSGRSVNCSLRRSASRDRDLSTPPSQQSVKYSLRRSASRERELTPSKGSEATSTLSTSRSQVGDLGVKQERGSYISRLPYSCGLKESSTQCAHEPSVDHNYHEGSFSAGPANRSSSDRYGREPSVDHNYHEGSFSAGPANRSSSDRYGREPSVDRSYREGSYSGGQNNRSSSRTAPGATYIPSIDHSSRASSVADLSRLGSSSTSSSSVSRQDYGSRRNSLQFYYDPGKYGAPKSERDLTGVRSIYTRNLWDTSDTIVGSGRRAPSSTYRPIVYTPGSPSPLRRSWAAGSDASSYSSLSASSNTAKMASFMTRNSVFPDFLTSRSSSQHGHVTPAYTQDSHESGLEGFKQKTLRLFSNNNSQKNSNNKSYGSGSPVSSNKSYQSTSQSNGTHKASLNANGNGSRNIYRQPQSLTNRNSGSRNQSADLRRKYFSQRMMWYSEADEDHMDQQDLDRNEKRHHSALELGSVSHSDLLRSDSTASCSSQESIDRDRSQQLKRKGTRPSVLKSASFDHYDSLDYRESRGLKEKSPSPSATKGGRRFSSAGLKLTKQASVRQGKGKQRTRFNDDVNVVYYDQEEKATALSGADTIHEQEKLKEDKTTSSTITESTVRLACTLHPGQMCGYNNLARLLASNQTSATEKAQEIQNNDNNDETTMNTATDKLATLDVTEMDSEGNMVRKSVFTNKSFEIVEEDGSHELKLIVPIGPEFIRNRTSVKATSGGKRLIVIGYRNEGEGDTAHVHQYIEKMTLPHPIDAYSVRATMDREGNLKISAPISVTTDQNNATSKATDER